jgi:iron complex outermembrane receptor protein
LKRTNAPALALVLLVAATPAAWAQSQPQPDAEKIESIVVQGQFLGSGAQSAMKQDIAVRDTPFTVQSYTESFMKAIETTNVADMYNYMTGVKRAGNTGYDLTIRGFKTGSEDKNAIMVDGLPGLTGRFGSPPTVGVDHIEVVKGPMSVLYGQIQPGGFVNIISKKPRSEASASVDVKGMTYAGDKLKFGDRSGYDVAADATGPLDADRKFLYRIVAEYGDRDLFRDFTYEKSLYFAPSATWNISDVTWLTVQFEHRDVKNAFDNGLAAPLRDIRLVAPITTRYQEPDDFRKEKGDAFSAQFSHAFNDDVTWNTSLRSVANQSDDAAYASVAVRPDNVTLQRRARQNHIERKYNYFDTSVNAQFATGILKHKLIVGANGGRDTDDENRKQFFNGGACPGPTCLDIDIYNPVYGRAPSLASLPAVNPGTPTLLTNQFFKSDSFGIYASDLVTITEQWKFVAGLRNTHEKQTIEEHRQANVPSYTKTADKSALPMAGLLFQPDRVWTLYTSYAESYVPVPANSLDVNNVNSFKPISGKQVEAGVKFENLFARHVNGTLAVFDIKRDNTLNTFTCAIGTCAEQLGEERSKGVELEMDVHPVKNWQVAFGYAFVDAKITSSRDPVQVGQRLPNVAKNSANLWSRYDIDSGLLKGLGIGLGVVYTGERSGILPSTADRRDLALPAYTVVDLAFSYIWERYAFNLKIGNLFDKTYYESTGQTAQVQVAPGAPRNVTLSMRVHF